MADYNINAATRRVVLSGSAGTGPYSFTFAVLVQTDLAVYLNSTKLTLTTDYTVSIATNGTGTVTLNTGTTNVPTTPGSSDSVIIVGARALERTTDFVTAGDLRASALNEQLDANVIFDQQLAEENQRTVKAPVFDPATTEGGGSVDMTLPAKDTRKGKYLAFNATTGNPEAGPSVSDVTTVSAAATDIALLADIQDGTTATNAITTVASNNANVAAVGGISANVTTVAGISSNVTTVAGKASLITSDFAADLNTLATADIVSDLDTVSTNISAVQGASGNATTATTKASEAAASATTATTKATEAASSATAAASSATAAASSETAAAASAASAATALDSFDDRYLGVKSSNPTVDNDGNALVAGALYFNDSANEMRVYDGANWIAATSAGNVSLILYEYTATAGQTTFSGSDDNSASLSYTVDNLQVVMNGVVLDPVDFTATNGTSVVLDSGATVGDQINIYAFKSFTTADMVSKTAGGTFSGAVGFSGGITGDVSFDTNTLHVDSTNNRVGIGTTSPNTKLDIVGSSTNGSGIVDTLRLRNTGTTQNDGARIQFTAGSSTSGAGIGSGGQALNSADLRFYAGGNTERMRIDSSGNVGIGTSSPSAGLHIDNPSNSAITAILDTDNSAVKMVFRNNTETGNNVQIGADGSNLVALTNGTERMRIDSSGHITSLPTYNNGSASSANVVVNSSGLFLRSVSARKYKADIEDVEASYAEALYGLRPVYYRSTLDADNSDHSHWGFIAEEVAAIDPRLVHYATHEVTYDDDGAAVETELDTPVAEGVQYERFVPLLLKLITDQKDRIEDLETQNADFEARLTALEAE